MSNNSILKTFEWIYNFNPKFIEIVWADDPNLRNHLRSKFSGYCQKDAYGSANAVCKFFANLDPDNKLKLAAYINRKDADFDIILDDPGEIESSFNYELNNF